MASKNTDPNLVEAALDAALEETKRLSDELVQSEEALQIATELLTLLVQTWRTRGDLDPIIDEVEDTLRRLRRVN